MSPQKTLRLLALCAALSGGFTAPLWAQDTQDGLPQPVVAGSATYITGGIGDAERAALEAVKKDYNLSILNADPNGEYVADVHVVVKDAKGTPMLSADAGPMFFAKLPEGRYTVEASYEGQNKSQKIRIGKNKTTHIHMGWK